MARPPPLGPLGPLGPEALPRPVPAHPRRPAPSAPPLRAAAGGCREALPDRPEASSGAVRLIVFDFDQTLSVVHVFKSLAGWGGKEGEKAMQVPRPFASTERGQVRRIREIDASSRPGSFAGTAFGGPVRVEQVRQCLRALREKDVELLVCTKGLIGVVKKCLSDLNLLDFFADVYGNIGSDTYGATAYDKQLLGEMRATTDEEARWLGSPDKADWGAKHHLIARLMRHRRLRREQVVLVEDDPAEIRRAGPVCRTLWVRQRAGLLPADFAALRGLCEAEPAGDGDCNSEQDDSRLMEQRFVMAGPGSGRCREARSRPPRGCHPLRELSPLGAPVAPALPSVAYPGAGPQLRQKRTSSKRRPSPSSGERRSEPARGGPCYTAAAAAPPWLRSPSVPLSPAEQAMRLAPRLT